MKNFILFVTILFAATASAQTTLTVNGVSFEMIAVKGGTFTMGSPESETSRDDDETQHQVSINDFYIGKYEVTQKQWEAITGKNPSYFKGDNLPVENVSWNEVQEFIKKLNTETGKNFRLPTEAEWEYACRAGTETPFHAGDSLTTDQANYNGNYPYKETKKGIFRKKTTAVGSFSPNAFGLYDMHGNVWEWCSDWYYDNYYRKSPTDNPQGSSTGANRVLRGGSWDESAKNCRSAYREYGNPDFRFDFWGFRLVESKIK